MSTAIKKSKSSVVNKRAPGKKIAAKGLATGTKTAVRKTSTVKTADPLTKKILKEAASVGFSKAAAKTMQVMGYNVIVQDGWVVKKFADGSIKKISKIKTTNNPVILD
jgi:phage-related protein